MMDSIRILNPNAMITRKENDMIACNDLIKENSNDLSSSLIMIKNRLINSFVMIKIPEKTTSLKINWLSINTAQVAQIKKFTSVLITKMMAIFENRFGAFASDLYWL